MLLEVFYSLFLRQKRLYLELFSVVRCAFVEQIFTHLHLNLLDVLTIIIDEVVTCFINSHQFR